MSVTLIINDNSKQALAFLKYAKSLDFVKIKKEKTVLTESEITLNPQQEKFKKRFTKALQNLEDARAGKVETQSLDDFLNSLK